jgi:hypothetical protein
MNLGERRAAQRESKKVERERGAGKRHCASLRCGFRGTFHASRPMSLGERRAAQRESKKVGRERGGLEEEALRFA